MATIEDVKKWYDRDLGRYAAWDHSVELVERNISKLRLRLYTDNQCYTITANDPMKLVAPGGGFAEGDYGFDKGYLGCIATCRKPRAGEDWNRGSDLADGPLTEETWHRILGDIVSYEVVRVHRKEDAFRAAAIPVTGPNLLGPTPSTAGDPAAGMPATMSA